jgi:putative sterol carrier protein
VTINSSNLTVQNGLVGQPNMHVVADATTWLKFLAKETNLLWALLTRRIRLRGNPKWLLAFRRCFPS